MRGTLEAPPMRARFAPLFTLSFVTLSVACSSSSSDGTPAKDAGSDTTAPTDTGGATDTATSGDTKPGDAKADTKPSGDTGGTDSAVEGAVCDPIAQTGCSGAKSKCTAVDDGAGGVIAGCMAPGGTAAADTSCTRTSEDVSGIGSDTCAPGAYCSSIGTYTTPPTRNCRKFCASDADCSGGKKCSALIPDPAGGTGWGICVPTCTLFGTDCASGMNCSVLIADTDGLNLYGTCRGVGTVAADATCKAAPECAADLVCTDPTSSGTSTCNALCDSTHACTGTKTCKTGGGLPGTDGLCQ